MYENLKRNTKLSIEDPTVTADEIMEKSRRPVDKIDVRYIQFHEQKFVHMIQHVKLSKKSYN